MQTFASKHATARCWIPSPQLVSHADQSKADQPQPSEPTHSSAASGRAPGHSAAPPAGHKTLRLRNPGPHNAEHADQPETCQSHPADSTHCCTIAGAWPCTTQRASAPPAHATDLSWVPMPQVALHNDQADIVQLQAAELSQASCWAGRSCGEQSSADPVEQATLRWRSPAPQSELHPDQAPATHAHGFSLRHDRALTGRSPSHRPSPASHTALLVSEPPPHVALHGDHPPTLQLQPSAR